MTLSEIPANDLPASATELGELRKLMKDGHAVLTDVHSLVTSHDILLKSLVEQIAWINGQVHTAMTAFQNSPMAAMMNRGGGKTSG